MDSRTLFNKNYPYVKAIAADVRDLKLTENSIDTTFLNACYSNIVDKAGAFSNISSMMKAGSRVVISHPLGKAFIHSLEGAAPFPLDAFPEEAEAAGLLKPFGFEVETFIDEPELYLLVAMKCSFKEGVHKVA